MYRIDLTDKYGQTIVLIDVTAVYSSITEDDVMCVQVHGESKPRRYNLKDLNYWEITE